MTNSAETNRYMGLAREALRATGAKLRKNFVEVFIEIMFLYVSVRKVNFTQMGKFGKHCEQTYRNGFTNDVDWVAYNTSLVRKVLSDPSDLLAVAVDQSHITKSGKCTWGVGRFWSGCDQSVKPGLEVTGLGIVNATRRECMAMRAVQTPGKEWLKEHPGVDGKEMDQHDWYIKVVSEHAKRLQAITDILVADELYSTEKIVTAMVLLGFIMVSRLRKDTVLRYVHTGPRTGKRGGYKLFFSTDIQMDAEKCVMVYKSRFQLDFAFNASLAAINTAKAAIKEMGADLSIGEYTALMHSTLIYQRIMCVSGIKPDPAINRKVMHELFMLAKNAA